jgi:hypothetical protein
MEPVDLTVNKSSEEGSRQNCESPEDGRGSSLMDFSNSDSNDSTYPPSWTYHSESPPSTCIDLRVKKGKPCFNDSLILCLYSYSRDN